ncbi:PREDICTED: uncharacterized protein LOC106118945 [Papilio xuthus]|uniref:Uncharacterized protein LOC106118945 n=1 Tax=Papilio xuthus TaxID=66420 RepID=A0AAJ7EAC1_PAPXU|nr:PREDICTED: uncharacterized protein LOC106118945 [Papilio xuthus]
MDKWKDELGSSRSASWTVDAIRPRLQDWTNRRWGHLSYRLVQMLSGHGCFGKYLHQIAGREPTPRCHHCPEVSDTVAHTLFDCPAWEAERRPIANITGLDASTLAEVISKILQSEDAWKAFHEFSERVLTTKENAEREREADPESAPLRRRRRAGRRRREFIRQA